MSTARTARAVAGLIATFALLVLGAGTASAHDVVVASDPAEGASLAAPPARVSVTFDEAPQAQFSTLTVVGPDGSRWEQGAAVTDGKTVSVPVRPLGPAGAYEVGYRIVSSDGHPVSGSIPFTLTVPGPGAAAAAPPAPAEAGQQAQAQPAPPQAQQSPAAAPTAPDTDEGGVPAWPFVVLAVVVVGGAVGLVLRRRSG